ncbi:hypothetical protein ACWEOW_09440 [Monashia sp. NPDC004114]
MSSALALLTVSAIVVPPKRRRLLVWRVVAPVMAMSPPSLRVFASAAVGCLTPIR